MERDTNKNKLANVIEIEEKLANYGGEDKVISFIEMKEIIKNRAKPEVSFKSGIPTFDELCGGFEGGELVVVSGITGNGKTTLCQSFTSNFHDKHISSLWFSYEVMPEQFLGKFKEMPVAYMPQILKDKTPNWLATRIWEAKLKYDVKAVFIDHLHYLVDMAVIRNPSLEIGQIMRNLKTIAVRFNIVIFLVSHTTKVRLDTEPDNEHLRDSSFISQEADCVLFVWRKINEEKEFTNLSTLKITKHRRAGIMGKKINLIYTNNKLSEQTNEQFNEQTII